MIISEVATETVFKNAKQVCPSFKFIAISERCVILVTNLCPPTFILMRAPGPFPSTISSTSPLIMLRADIFSGFLIARVTSFAKTLKYILLPTGTSICGKNNLEPEKSNSVIPSDACVETVASINEERSLKPSF